MQAAAPGRAGGGLDELRSRYLEAALRGERATSVAIVREALDAGHELGNVYVELLQAAQYEVGRLWETNVISVAREHMATVVTQFVLAELSSALPGRGGNVGRAVIAGVEGELHQVGANLVADYLELNGWTVRFLGTAMPAAGVIDVVREERPMVLGISATMLFSADRVGRLIETVRGELGDDAPAILVGGGAFRHAPDLWRELGADGTAADARDALTLAARYTG